MSRRLREMGIRDIPRGPRPATRANPAHLTAREAEVVRLVAQGLRNGEIAERLSVTAKTVDHHVSAALSKLGPERLEAVKEAARLGLLGTGLDRPGDRGWGILPMWTDLGGWEGSCRPAVRPSERRT